MSLLPYRPHPLLRNGHLQTVMVGLLCGERPHYNARQILVPLEDADPDERALVIHEELGPPIAKDADLVVLMHGLGGDHRSAYLERLAPRLRAAGFHVWRLDLRGCGIGLEHACRPANAGRSADLALALREATRRFPQHAIHVVGFSLSGNILLKMLGEIGSGSIAVPEFDGKQIRSALAIAPPVQLYACADNMERPSRAVYTRFYLKMLSGQVRQRRNRWPRWNQIPESPPIRTIRQFDARYTAPLSGFANTTEYYNRSSSAEKLLHVSHDTTILFDRHDPIVPYQTILDAELSPSTKMIETRLGGHMGYFGLDERGRLIRWLEYYVEQFLREKRRQHRSSR